MQSDSVTSSEDEESDSDAYEEKVEDKKRLLDYLLLELAASHAFDAAVERTLQIELMRLKRNIDYTPKEYTQGTGEESPVKKRVRRVVQPPEVEPRLGHKEEGL